MPSLLLPVNIGGDLSQIPLPESLSRFRLAGISWLAMQQPGMEYWHQEIRVNGFIIGQSFRNKMRQPTISCQTDEPSAILYYTVQGDVDFQVDTVRKGTLSEGHYCLLICPAATPIELRFSTSSQHSVQLSLSLHLLQHLPGFSNNTDERIERPTNQFQVYPPFLPITRFIRSVWNQFLFQQGPSNQSDFIRLNEGCLKLLSRFSIDWTKTRRQQQWKQRKEIRVEELEAYLADHLDAESRPMVTEATCARKVGMSVNQFQKFWKKRSGLSLTQYLLKSRMEKARRLLLTGEYTPATIFLQVGYWNFSGFSRAFTTWYGFSPSRLNEQEE